MKKILVPLVMRTVPEPRLPVPLAVTTKVPEMTLAVCRPLGPLLSCKPETAPVAGVMVTVPT